MRRLLSRVDVLLLAGFCVSGTARAQSQVVRAYPELAVPLLSIQSSSAQLPGRGLTVYVIAPSASTSLEATTVRTKLGWTETANLRKTDCVMVMVRSMLLDPLRLTYDSVKELERDAEGQLNVVGERFHLYLYRLSDELALTQMAHQSWDAGNK